MRQSMIVAYSFGMFLVSYVVFTEPAKYEVPSIVDWIMVEGITGILQYGIFGVFMGVIHKKFK